MCHDDRECRQQNSGVDKASVNLATEIMTVEATDSVTLKLSPKWSMVWDTALVLVANQWKNSEERTKEEAHLRE